MAIGGRGWHRIAVFADFRPTDRLQRERVQPVPALRNVILKPCAHARVPEQAQVLGDRARRTRRSFVSKGTVLMMAHSTAYAAGDLNQLVNPVSRLDRIPEATRSSPGSNRRPGRSSAAILACSIGDVWSGDVTARPLRFSHFEVEPI